MRAYSRRVAIVPIGGDAMDRKPALESLEARAVPAVLRPTLAYAPPTPVHAAQEAVRAGEMREQAQRVAVVYDAPGQLPVKGQSQAEQGTDAPSIVPGGKMGPRRAPGSWIHPSTRPEGVAYQRWYY